MDYIGNESAHQRSKKYNDGYGLIIINIYTSFVPNLTIIELPGYSMTCMNSPPDIKVGLTNDMIMR